MTALKLEFLRFEFKYVLHKKLRAEVEAELGHFLQFDPFVESTPHHQYVVRSLYFDDPVHSAFYDKIDGLRTRSKFRIRTYSRDFDPSIPQFLEEKGRHDNMVFKHRVPLPGRLIGEASTAAVVESFVESGSGGNDVVDKFRYAWFRKQIRPVALVDYLRRPYVSRYDPEFRVTFDEQLFGTDTMELFPPRWQQPTSLVTGYTVMEVKFRRHLPAWFHRIIQSYELRRVSISKICTAMEALGMAVDLQ